MTGILGSEIQDLTTPRQTNDNDKTIRDALRATYSRGILAGSSLPITSTSSLDPRYTSFFFDTTGGAITATLPQANYWGPNKCPLLLFHYVAGTANVTIQASGSDTIDGVSSKILSVGTGDFFLYTDGISKWTSFSMSSPVDSIPTVTQDIAWTSWTEAAINIVNVWADLNLASTATTTSNSLQTAVNYTGSGILTLAVLAELTHSAVTPFNGIMRVTIDGNVVINSTLITRQAMIRPAIAGMFIADNSGNLYISQSQGLPFARSCKIEIQSDGTRTVTAAWNLIKKT